MLDDLKEKWPEILDFFKQEYDIADVSFKTWILPLEVESFDNNMITLVFPGESGPSNPLMKLVAVLPGAWMNNFVESPVLWIFPA